MRRLRRKYYDAFSHIYDWVIKVHSSDKSEKLREFLVTKAQISEKDFVLDLCTGTGSVAIHAFDKTKDKGIVIGVDFSKGMLIKARQKSKGKNIYWIQANAAFLPFKNESFNVVLCSHAFYELKTKEKYWCLAEVLRVLKPKGRFCMMEHDEPDNSFIRFLYKIRLFTLGSFDTAQFVKKEMRLFSLFFSQITKEKSPSGNSKLYIGVKK